MNDSAGRSVFLFPGWMLDSNRSYLDLVHFEVYRTNAVKGFGGVGAACDVENGTRTIIIVGAFNNMVAQTWQVATYIPGAGAGLGDRMRVDREGKAPRVRPHRGWGGRKAAGGGEQGVAAQLRHCCAGGGGAVFGRATWVKWDRQEKKNKPKKQNQKEQKNGGGGKGEKKEKNTKMK